jgi:PilZ domain
LINSVNTETRRKSARTKVASSEIVYLHFQTANGAVALDVSAEGIGFQAASPLEPNELLPFRLSVPGFPEITLSGQVVWLDSTRKRGGMRLNVPPESLALFEKWRRKYIEPAAERAELSASAGSRQAPPAGPQATPELRRRTTEDRAPAAAATPKSAETQPAESPRAPAPEPPRASPPPPPNPFAARPGSMLGSHGPIFVSEWELPPETPRTGRNILVACVIIGLCIVIAGGSYYLAGKRAVGNMLVNLGQQIGGANQPTPASASQPAAGTAVPNAAAPSSAALPQTTPAPNPPADSSPATAPDASEAPAATLPPHSQAGATAGNPAAASRAATASPTAQPTNAGSVPANTDASTAKLPQAGAHSGTAAGVSPLIDTHPRPGSRSQSASAQGSRSATTSADDGAADLNQALKYLQGPNSQDSAVAEQFLWSAISAGNTQADLVLGELYMRGQGAVHRNCRQAAILLHAALVADVPGAGEKIGELQTYGCR